MIFIIVIIIYILSLFLSWNYMRVAHSKGGIWGLLNPGTSEMFLIVSPGINTVIALLWIIAPPKEDSEYNWNKFFKVKK